MHRLILAKHLTAIINLIGNRRKRALVVSVALSHLTACNVVGPANNPSPTDVQLSSLVVSSTDGTFQTPAVLDSTQRGGAFVINWQQYSPSPYTTFVYLSSDNVVDQKDLRLYLLEVSGQSTSLGPNVPVANFSPSINCTYQSDNSINCGTKVNIQTFLDQLPKSATVIVESCLTEETQRCKQISYSIVLQ